MGALSLAMQSDISHSTEEHDCLLVAPPEVVAAAYATGLHFTATCAELPENAPANGIVVYLPHSPLISDLPPDWVGVWARIEPPPPGSWIPLPATALTDIQALGHALHTADTWRRERRHFTRTMTNWTEKVESAKELAIALTAERDPQCLLTLILSRARQFVPADAGSLYLVQRDQHGQASLRFTLAQNDSVNAPWQESWLPLKSTSVAGALAQFGNVVNIDDVYHLPSDVPFHHDNSFDRRFGYRTRSVVGIPLAKRDGEVLGVLQLINRKPVVGVPLEEPTIASEVMPFSTADVEMLCPLASLAAVSLEKSLLYQEIERLFEGFAHAAVASIEQRDPTMSGHSFRVAEGTIALAQRVECVTRGPWAGTRFSVPELRELRYAALLHDFGKIGVPEKVLTKPRKLYDEDMQRIEDRFRLAAVSQRARRLETWLYAALQDPHGTQARLPQLFQELEQEAHDLGAMLCAIHAANQPNITSTGDYSALEAIHHWQFTVPQGEPQSLLTEREMELLSLRRGSLSPEERVVIQSHVTHTYNFLRMIPWTRDLARVPDLAYTHHEKLDGSGYPRGLTADDIPLGVRMMTIADIFDALTTSDRPYKTAVPLERALGLLEDEARKGQLDTTLVQLWIEARIWEDIQGI